ncbi:MAG: hypothetical protein ACOYKZ_08165 [Chlamydiia bacterium]
MTNKRVHARHTAELLNSAVTLPMGGNNAPSQIPSLRPASQGSRTTSQLIQQTLVQPPAAFRTQVIQSTAGHPIRTSSLHLPGANAATSAIPSASIEPVHTTMGRTRPAHTKTLYTGAESISLHDDDHATKSPGPQDASLAPILPINFGERFSEATTPSQLSSSPVSLQDPIDDMEIDRGHEARAEDVLAQAVDALVALAGAFPSLIQPPRPNPTARSRVESQPWTASLPNLALQTLSSVATTSQTLSSSRQQAPNAFSTSTDGSDPRQMGRLTASLDSLSDLDEHIDGAPPHKMRRLED